LLRLLGHRLSSTEIGVASSADQPQDPHLANKASIQSRDSAQAVVLAYETGLLQSGGSTSDLDSPTGTVRGTWLVDL